MESTAENDTFDGLEPHSLVKGYSKVFDLGDWVIPFKEDRRLDLSGNYSINGQLLALELEREQPRAPPSLGKPSKHMWITKYSPSRYTDLINSEHTNRIILTWFHSWKATNQKTKTTTQTSQPILLLHGPTAAGKSCAINVMIKHCNFNLINISEPSINLLKDSIHNHNLNGKLNCIVLDQLDTHTHLPQNFIQQLLQLTKICPIVIVVNNLYTPMLKPLRNNPTCLVVQFKPPTTQSIAKRCLEICKLEGLKVDLRGMIALAESCREIQTSLMHLQFLATKTKDFTYNSLSTLLTTHHHESNLFESCELLLGPRRGDAVGMDKVLEKMSCQSLSDLERIHQALFESYPTFKGIDPTLDARQSRACKSVEEASCFDVTFHMVEKGNWEMLKYLPFQLFSWRTWKHQRVMFPTFHAVHEPVEGHNDVHVLLSSLNQLTSDNLSATIGLLKKTRLDAEVLLSMSFCTLGGMQSTFEKMWRDHVVQRVVINQNKRKIGLDVGYLYFKGG